jgi:hypothetical protein
MSSYDIEVNYVLNYFIFGFIGGFMFAAFIRLWNYLETRLSWFFTDNNNYYWLKYPANEEDKDDKKEEEDVERVTSDIEDRDEEYIDFVDEIEMKKDDTPPSLELISCFQNANGSFEDKDVGESLYLYTDGSLTLAKDPVFLFLVNSFTTMETISHLDFTRCCDVFSCAASTGSLYVDWLVNFKAIRNHYLKKTMKSWNKNKNIPPNIMKLWMESVMLKFNRRFHGIAVTKNICNSMWMVVTYSYLPGIDFYDKIQKNKHSGELHYSVYLSNEEDFIRKWQCFSLALSDLSNACK